MVVSETMTIRLVVAPNLQTEENAVLPTRLTARGKNRRNQSASKWYDIRHLSHGSGIPTASLLSGILFPFFPFHITLVFDSGFGKAQRGSEKGKWLFPGNLLYWLSISVGSL